MNRMDMTTLFASQLRASRESLLSGLEGLLGAERHWATLVPFASELQPSECFKGGGPHRSFECLGTQGGVTTFRLNYLPGPVDENKRAVSGIFFVSDIPAIPGVYLAATVEPTEFVRKAWIPFVERNRSRMYLTFMMNDYLRALLQEFRDNEQYDDLRVIRTSFVARFTEGNGETRIPSVNWPKLGLDGTFSYAQEQNGWFRSLTFKALKNSRSLAEITISRNGILRTDAQFGAVYRRLVLPICLLISENVKLFSKRSRRDNQRLDVRPLTIEFGNDQFNNTGENAKFIEAMRKFDNASVSVVHGNPYLAMSVVDYFDSSTFDLWVLNPRELVIVPQLKSSVPAIKRLISHVFDNYAEGNVRDFQTSRQ